MDSEEQPHLEIPVASTDIQWDECTSQGADRAYIREALRWTIRQCLECLNDMCDLARSMIAERQKKGLAYIDPYTGECVKARKI